MSQGVGSQGCGVSCRSRRSQSPFVGSTLNCVAPSSDLPFASAATSCASTVIRSCIDAAPPGDWVALVMPVVASPVPAFAVGDCCRARAAASAWLNIASAIALGSSLVLSVPSALVLSVAAGAAASVAVVSVSSLSQRFREQLEQAQTGLIGAVGAGIRAAVGGVLGRDVLGAGVFWRACAQGLGPLRRWRLHWLRKRLRHRGRSCPGRIVHWPRPGSQTAPPLACCRCWHCSCACLGSRWNRRAVCFGLAVLAGLAGFRCRVQAALACFAAVWPSYPARTGRSSKSSLLDDFVLLEAELSEEGRILSATCHQSIAPTRARSARRTLVARVCQRRGLPRSGSA